MSNIPELDEMVWRLLDTQDLARCARVNKAWHKAILPHLWRNVALRYPSHKQEEAFGRVILEDYLYEQQQKAQESEHAMDQPTHPPWSSSLPALTKHCRWIQKAKGPEELLSILGRLIISSGQNQATLERSGRVELPTAHELLQHFYRRCPVLQVEHMRLSTRAINSDAQLFKMITEDVVLRVRSLEFGERYGLGRINIQPSKLKRLLDRLSSTLEFLHIELHIQATQKEESDLEEDTEESKVWPKLKRLTLRLSVDSPDQASFRRWLWQRCGHVRVLTIYEAGESVVQSLAENMPTCMPNVQEFDMGPNSSYNERLKDQEIAAILNGSRQGWKRVWTRPLSHFGNASKEALAKHFSTLEELWMDGCRDFQGPDQVRALAFCPNLHTFTSINDGGYPRDTILRPISASTFIDRDPSTGSLKPWLCEESLKDLKVMISDIPRPDLKTSGLIRESNPGQGRELQALVYERIARFTNLETLWLGMDSYHTDTGSNGSCEDDDDEEEARWFQRNCLEMSLDSGLHKLSALKNLRELSVIDMEHKIRLKDVQWMVENWPKLKTIFGLSPMGKTKHAVEWLKKNHPKIPA
ncbi:MAG: hypothetical protein J3Q66DRAFT_28313 [Benniella sp.]|nr:MAG: hypothetical protein J3Q66DRAFT_28313 [Benniella sp.]